MNLFDEFDRESEGPALYAEPQFSYLNRSSRKEISAIREVLDKWFGRYPEEGQRELRGRFRSSDDVQHRSAFFELFLHELLLRLGYSIQIHPDVGDGCFKHPDFLVTSPNGSRFYLEATIATDESEQESAAQNRMNQVYDSINRLESPNFFIGMELSGSPKTPVPSREIKSFLKKRLASLDPDELAEHCRNSNQDILPRWRYQHEGWIIDFYPIPKPPEARGKTGIRPLAVFSSGIKIFESRLSIRGSIESKAKRYRKLKLPYVIAVNALAEIVERSDVMEALFGKEQFTFNIDNSEESEPVMTRALDGIWTRKTGPRYTRVSAVLITTKLRPSNVPRAPICLYHNPYTDKPLVTELTRLSQAVPNNIEGRMEWQEGESLSSIFGLHSNWPEIDRETLGITS